jgi:hypothetical protein
MGNKQEARGRAVDRLEQCFGPLYEQAGLSASRPSREQLEGLVEDLVDAILERPTPHAAAVEQLRSMDPIDPRD